MTAAAALVIVDSVHDTSAASHKRTRADSKRDRSQRSATSGVSGAGHLVSHISFVIMCIEIWCVTRRNQHALKTISGVSDKFKDMAPSRALSKSCSKDR